jgi:hypothetical protein
MKAEYSSATASAQQKFRRDSGELTACLYPEMRWAFGEPGDVAWWRWFGKLSDRAATLQ